MKYNCIRNSDSPEVMRARVKHGIAAYGIYVALMQLLEEDEDHKLSKDYSMIAYEMRVDVSVVQSVVEDFDLFEVEEEYFYSKELSDTIEQARKVSEARARAGRAGGAAKARNFVANAKESSSKCQANASESLANAKQARKVSEARARAGRAGGAAKARNFVANAKESSSKCQANASESLANATNSLANATDILANASESLANAKQMPESKESSPNPSKNIYSVPTEREDNIKLSSPSSARTRKSKPKEFTICHKGRQIFEKYYQELYDSAYYWQPKDAKAMNSILKKISFARSHKTVPLPIDGQIFEKYYQELYDSAYYWQPKDAKAMNSILKKISFARSHKTVPLPIDDESLLKALEEFLRRIDKTWIMNNFSVNKIDSQYNEIVSEMKNHRQNVTDNGNNTKTGWKAPDHKDTSAYRSGFGVAVGK